MAFHYNESGLYDEALDYAQQVSLHPVARYVLGNLYSKGHGVEKNEGEARICHHEAAKSGFSVSQVHMGLGCFKVGLHAEALEWYRKAAKAGNPAGQYLSGMMIYYGHGVPPDPREGALWIGKAADQGYMNAVTGMGIICRNQKEYADAMEWFKKAPEDRIAQYNIGHMYYSGWGVEPNYTTAKEWFQRAADLKYGEAEYAIGTMYHYGRGETKDLDKAIDWYKKAMRHGAQDAVIELYVALSEANQECKTKEERLQRLKSKARQGNGVVANHLGHMYRTGTKVVENEKEALEWYLLAANMNCAEAQCTMGVHYHDIDHDAAEMWYLKAEKQGNQRTWSNLGDLMIAQRRYIKAAEWYRKAASVNDASAQYSLGEMYFQGFILKDDTLALEWYSKAAAQGYADAEASLGYMYHHGRGTKSNYEEAEKWYLRAIEQGHLEAQRSLEEMRKDKAAWDWNQEILRTMVSVDGDGECLDPTKFALMIEKLNECSLGPMDYFQNDTEKSRKDESEVTCLPLYKMN
ncbi:hypothetical protein EDD21DRAFT_310072 [Dissophora ornata]|nr:hypothetical protein EDD21DRAFT_310072 [Dissophora ornata]